MAMDMVYTARDAVRDVVTSKAIRRTILKVTLLAASAFALLLLSIVATALFYNSYVPDKSLTWPVYLQYGVGVHPFGFTSLTGNRLKVEQGYDVSVSIKLPHSPVNLDRGNFMVVLHLLESNPDLNLVYTPQNPASGLELVEQSSVIQTMRRPALLPYVDPAVSLARRLILLPLRLVTSGTKQAHAMSVRLAEGVSFPRTSGLPRAVYVEVQAGQGFQTYEVSVTMTAKLRGLRWVLHNYRTPSFIMLSMGFWTIEMLFAAVALYAVGLVLSPRGGSGQEGKGKKLVAGEKGGDIARIEKGEAGEGEEGDEDGGAKEEEGVEESEPGPVGKVEGTKKGESSSRPTGFRRRRTKREEEPQDPPSGPSSTVSEVKMEEEDTYSGTSGMTSGVQVKKEEVD